MESSGFDSHPAKASRQLEASLVSFGYRAGRHAHQALQAIRSGIMATRGYWVVEVDVRKYFDSIPRTQLRECLARRVSDGVVRRLIDKWLKAGVLQSGQVHYPGAGTPQGGVISPILSNVFLHHVIDVWFTEQVRPRLRGPGTLVRFCDDLVMLFARREEAERVLAVPGKRLEKFGLQPHPDKTRRAAETAAHLSQLKIIQRIPRPVCSDCRWHPPAKALPLR